MFSLGFNIRSNKGKENQTKRVLAIASAGGHWQQLLRMQPAFKDCHVTYATTLSGLAEESGLEKAHVVPDFSQSNKVKVIYGAICILLLIVRVRPNVIVTTGAAPGFIALVLGKIFRKKTIWVDSIANAEELSMAGRMAGKWADTWLTQWPHLHSETGPHYKGAVL